MLLPLQSLDARKSISELVHFQIALRSAVDSMQVTCDDNHPIDSQWTQGSETSLDCGVLRSARYSSDQAPPIKPMIAAAFTQGRRMLASG